MILALGMLTTRERRRKDCHPTETPADMERTTTNGSPSLCSLAERGNPLIQAMRAPLEPGVSPIERLDPTGYYGQELETMQKQDRTQQWFIKQLRGQPKPNSEMNNRRGDPEAAVMMDNMAKYSHN